MKGYPTHVQSGVHDEPFSPSSPLLSSFPFSHLSLPLPLVLSLSFSRSCLPLAVRRHLRLSICRSIHTHRQPPLQLQLQCRTADAAHTLDCLSPSLES